MEEQRKEERLKEYNEITVSVISDEENLPKEKISYNYSEDISVSGTKIRGKILLPIDTLLKIDFTLKAFQNQITAHGKVKWIKVVIEDKDYEAGVEFVDTPSEAVKRIGNYISWKKKNTNLKPAWIFAQFIEMNKVLKGFNNYEDFLNYVGTIVNKPIEPTKWIKELYLELLKKQDKVDPLTELKNRAEEIRKKLGL